MSGSNRTSATWRIEPLQQQHFAAAADLYAQAFAGAPAGRLWRPTDFADLLSGGGTFGLLLVRDCQACGIAVARQVADEAELLVIGVLPQVRRVGGASRLLDRIVETSRVRGVRQMFLEVAEDNAAARQFYYKHRFVEVGRRPGYYPRPALTAVAAILMRLDID